jgi:N-acetylated-alpha-linked acidic dipeptidase
MRRLPLFLLLVCLLMLVVPAFAQAAPTYNQAVDQLFAQGYPQALENYITSLGTSPVGMRFAGSLSDNAAARFIAKTLREAGFVNVRLEPVPIDVQNFRGASVTVGDRVMTASTYGGVPPTPCGGITGEVVYVGAGTAADFAAAGDVTGKIVVISANLNSWWMNIPWNEATLHGAAGIIYTSARGDDAYYADPTVLGSFDAECTFSGAPAVFIRGTDGMWLEDLAMAGPVTATMVNDSRYTFAKKGGVGYNVLGELPGRRCDGQLVVISAHHDGYFHSGIDDAGGVINALTMAKAMKMSHYKPQRSIVLMLTTGEEYGRINSYYDWLIGSWYAITHSHADWPGKVAAQINLESEAMTGASLTLRANPELNTLVNDTLAANPGYWPWGYSLLPVFSWNDQWPFTARGVPSIYFRARTGYYGTHWYHSEGDTKDIMDWGYEAKLNKLADVFVTKFAGQGVLPYSFADRASELAGTIDGTELLAAGADPGVVARLTGDLADFQSAAAWWEANRASVPARAMAAVNKTLLKLEVALNGNFTALDVWDLTIYPHQQVLLDLESLNAAIAALQPPTPDQGAALSALQNVGLTVNGLSFSYEVYKASLAVHAANWPGGLYWGALGHLAPYLDVMPEYDMVAGGDYAGGLAALLPVRSSEVAELNVRLAHMADVLESVTPRIEALP